MINIKIDDFLTKSLKWVSEISTEKCKLLETFDFDQNEAIKRYARISSVGSSTRIENAILTDTEVDWLDNRLKIYGKDGAYNREKDFIKNKLSKDAERSIEEVVGYRNVLGIIFSQATDLFPLGEVTIRGLHKELLIHFPAAWHYLGKYKSASNSVIETNHATGEKREILTTAAPGPVTEAAMSDLIRWYNKNVNDYLWPIVTAAEFIFRFLAIHPFQDGNGRLGRALFAMAILQSSDKKLKKIIPYIAIDRHIEKRREEYYYILRRCSDGKYSNNPSSYKMEYFLRFMLNVIEDALLNDIDYYANKFKSFQILSDSAQEVLKIFKENPEKKLKTANIVKLANLPRRTAVYAVNLLLKNGFLHKTGRGPSTGYRLIF